jgi:DNA (cytosine-5)-methyltransferase 1
MKSAIDLFSGCGGVSCGLSLAGFRVKGAVEIDQKAVDVYLKYPPLSKTKVIVDDIKKVSGDQILKAACIDKKSFYLLAGCPPCQNFSFENRENRNKPESEREELLKEYLRIVQEIYPPFILMENVPGIASDFNKNILSRFLGSLTDEKKEKPERYVLHYGVLNAADYGVPQSRKRFVIQGVRSDVADLLVKFNISFDLPKPGYGKTAKKGIKPWVTVSEAIGDLPPIAEGSAYEGKEPILNHRCAALSPKNLKRMRYIREHGGTRTCLPPDMALKCHSQKEDGTCFNGHKDVYGIMDPDKPSPTITGGCLFYTKGRFGHYSQDRALSIREAARIQTFPDDFAFSDNLAESALQIGNAVPVKLVEASGKVFSKVISELTKALKNTKQTAAQK